MSVQKGGPDRIDAVLDADYSGALSILLRYPSPEPHSPQAFVQDALYLEQNPTAERGGFLIAKYSGRPPESPLTHSRSLVRPAMTSRLWEEFKRRSESTSPISASARNSPKSLETLLQDVSQGIQRRTEAWGVAKAVRGAVTEARRNMPTMNYDAASRLGATRSEPSSTAAQESTTAELGLQTRLDRLQERNQELASTLSEALKDLREQLGSRDDSGASPNESVKGALDRIESVKKCLADSIVPAAASANSNAPRPDVARSDSPQSPAPVTDPAHPPKSPSVSEPLPRSPPVVNMPNLSTGRATKRPDAQTDGLVSSGRERPRSVVRPSLSDAGFSWMLGGNRTLSTFVSPASVPPEQTRHHDHPRGRNGPLFKNHADDTPKTAEADRDELALHNLSGSRGPL